MKVKQIVIRPRLGACGHGKDYGVVTDEPLDAYAMAIKAGLSAEMAMKISEWAGSAEFGDVNMFAKSEKSKSGWIRVEVECRRPPWDVMVPLPFEVRDPIVDGKPRKKRRKKRGQADTA